MNEIISYIVIGIGLLFNVFGCVGLIRMPDVYNRLQAATKCVTLGTCFILIGVLIRLGFTPAGVKVIIAIVFLLITSSTAAHALARASYKSGVKMCDISVCDEYGKDQEKE